MWSMIRRTNPGAKSDDFGRKWIPFNGRRLSPGKPGLVRERDSRKVRVPGHQKGIRNQAGTIRKSNIERLALKATTQENRG
jgi:hypothetical protein